MKQPKTLSARAPMILGTVTLVCLIGGFGLWSVTSEISGAIVAPGRVEVELNRQIVQHPDGGVVSSIDVVEGANVVAGDILIRLDGTLLNSELVIVEGQLYEVQARRARLEAERDGLNKVNIPSELSDLAASRAEVAAQVEGQLRLFDARADTLSRTLEQLDKRQGQIRSQIEGIRAQETALSRQLELIGLELTDQLSLLEKGLAQAPRVLGVQREEARLSGIVGELAATRAQAESRVTETEIEVLRLTAARREEASQQLRDIGSAELELAERRNAILERIARLDIRAPVSGTVLGLQVTTPRAVLRPADPVAYLVPQDRPLVITVQVPPIHIDEVAVGQAVKLVFPTFSARTTPELDGEISLVSADALTDSASNLSFYRAEITLSATEVERLGHTLLPGMPVEAFVQTTPRTPLAYLVKPFTDYFVRAFRES